MFKKILLSFLFLLFFTSSILWGQEVKFGICVESVVPVRGNTEDKAEQVTQLLFGDAFMILEYSKDKKWILIQNSYDNYQGWIHTEQAKPISETYYQAYCNTVHPVVADMNSIIWIDEQRKTLSIGSTLPFLKDGWIEIDNQKYIFEGSAKSIAQKSSKEKLIETARKYLGIPYLWGGKSQKGVDCSGFSQMVFKLNGYVIPRDSYQQAEKGKMVSLEEAKPGDLAFFQKQPEGNGKVKHVGIYLGNGKIIHADGEVRINTLDKTGIFRDDLNQYSHYLKYLKRFD